MKDNIDNLKEGLKLIKEGQSKLNSGPFSFYLEKLISAYDYLKENCSPFNIGDTVEIIKNIDFNKCSGWYSSKHFLCIGNKAIVRNIDWSSDGHFIIEIEPFNQTYFFDKKEKSVSKPYIYSFHPSYLRISNDN